MSIDIQLLRKDSLDALALVKEWEHLYEAKEMKLLEVLKKENDAYNQLCRLEKEMVEQHEAEKESDENYRKVWDEFEDFLFCADVHRALLNLQIKTENEKMVADFKKCKEAIKDKDSVEEAISRASGKEHKDNLARTRVLLEELERKVRDAEVEAEAKAPRTGARYLEAKDEFRMAKNRYERLSVELQECERERDRVRTFYNDAREVYEAIEQAIAVAEMEETTTTE